MKALVTSLLALSCGAFAQDLSGGKWSKQPIDIQTAAPAGQAQVVDIPVNRSTVIDFKPGFRRVSVGSSDIAEAVAVSSVELLLNGRAPGQTDLILWDKAGKRTTYDVRVTADLSAIEHVREQLKKELGDDVTIDVQGPSVFLRGKAKNLIEADRAVAIASTTGKVINLLQVDVPPADPQILLKVRFASLDRTLADQLGVNLFSGKYTKGNLATQTGQFGNIGASGALNGSTSSFLINNLLNILYWRPDIDMGAVLQDLETKSVLQILAEPNVLALSGHTASFLAGGEFPFPTLQGGGSGVGQITVQFREFGIRLKFLPEVTPRGTIHLMVEPEVSSLDYSNGLSVTGFTVPGLATRRIETEMELENGQSFVIAGLLDANTTESLDRLPGISNIPILGKLFQSRSINKNKGELLVLVTPELVQPIKAGEPLPQLDTPKGFLAGELPKGTSRPSESPVTKVASLPIEQLKAMAAKATADSGPVYTPGASNTASTTAPAPPAPASAASTTSKQ